MGTWGHLFDQNDDAVGFLMELAYTPAWEMVETALQTFAASQDDFDVDVSYAAAEIVAAGMGRPAVPAGERMSVVESTEPHLPFDWRKVVSWAQTDREAARRLAPLALTVVEAIPANESLRGEWEDAGELDGWLGGLLDLHLRLQASIDESRKD
ncbi:DUF4259 domain-containing protein [Sandarakinorhabdus rubra]|uniref:DUF4259 domain-containing protein n=1 Tax=Sandarakinorhabdus rubra TaxID=2672568 RepID=UPI0013DC82C1|nr:DUF4259 domain-containing protein [Sandarakinorhabdus rubra]